MALGEVLLQVFIIFVAAKIAGEVCLRLAVPSVVGELLAGVVLGPHALGLIGLPGPAMIAALGDYHLAEETLGGALEILAEIGVIVLLFTVGLETRLSDILQVGKRASLVALGGVVLPLGAGYLFGTALGEPLPAALFLGAALVATSVGITARVLGDLGQLTTDAARIILGAAVVDDILGLLVLAMVSGLATGGLSPVSVVVLAVEAFGFTALVVLVGRRALIRFDDHLDDLRLPNSRFAVALAVCLGLAVAAGYLGLAAIVGAFLAGMVFAEARDREELERQAGTLYDVLVPFFFVVSGTQVDPALFLDPTRLAFAAGLTLLAIITKMLGAAAGGAGLKRKELAVVAVGMVPRGEVGLVVAGIGRATGALTDELFSDVVMMSLVTALIVPPVLQAILRRPERSEPREEVE
ncbi:MAG: cation:proton antiporter [Chloroflexi bacterium]|nr:cation:proton antiporter [Chloroflexota bacterium]